MVRELKRLDPESEVLALGGHELEDAGARVDYSIDRFAFMGFAEIVAGLPRILSLERKMKRLLKSGGIDLLLLGQLNLLVTVNGESEDAPVPGISTVIANQTADKIISVNAARCIGVAHYSPTNISNQPANTLVSRNATY